MIAFSLWYFLVALGVLVMYAVDVDFHFTTKRKHHPEVKTPFFTTRNMVHLLVAVIAAFTPGINVIALVILLAWYFSAQLYAKGFPERAPY